MESTPEGSLKNLLSKTYKWIFVGGKGGVGKTTTSSTLSLTLASQGRKVLIISTDPAHNLSDCFDQPFAKEPVQVQGVPNLFGMEIDPKVDSAKISIPSIPELEISGESSEFMSEFLSSVPGIDEAMSFAELIKTLDNMDFDTVVFDTAPTGHTLRFLQFPAILEKGLNKLMTLKAKFQSIYTSFATMLGQQNADETYNAMFSKVEALKNVTETVRIRMEDSSHTTFLAVCIPEFLSVYETERLVQELAKNNIDIGNIVVNQLVMEKSDCRMCKARQKMQSKYIGQIQDLYEDFHVCYMPLLEEEVRGIDHLKNFSNLLLTEKKYEF